MRTPRLPLLALICVIPLTAAVAGDSTPGSAPSRSSGNEEPTTPPEPKPPWIKPEAKTRLLVLPALATNHTMRVAVPPHLQSSTKSVAVYNHNGQPLTFYPVFIDERAVAVEISVPRSLTAQIAREAAADARADVAIQVYLFENPGTSRFDSNWRRPVRMRTARHTRKRSQIVGRPLTCEQFRHLSRRFSIGKYGTELQSFPNQVSLSPFHRQFSGKQMRRYELATAVLINEPSLFEIAIRNNDAGAWFLFIDRKPVCSWTTATRNKEGYFVSPAIALEPGFHEIELSGIMTARDGIADIVKRSRPQPAGEASDGEATEPPFEFFDTKKIYCANLCTTVMIETRKNVLTAGIQISFDRDCNGEVGNGIEIQFVDVDTRLVAATIHDLSRNLYGREIVDRRITIDDMIVRLPERENIMLLPSRLHHDVVLEVTDAHGFTAALTCVVPQSWTKPETAHMRFRIGDLPLLAPVEAPWPLEYLVENIDKYVIVNSKAVPETSTPKIVLDRLNFVVRYYDRDGHLIDKAIKPLPASPAERIFSYGYAHDTVQRIELMIGIREFPVAAPINIYILDSTLDTAYTQRSGQLWYKDGFAVLRREKVYTDPAPPLKTDSNIIIVDDFIAAARHPTNDLDVTAWCAANLDINVEHLPLPPHQVAPGNPELRKFEVLDKIAQSSADAVIWNIGMHDLIAGTDLRDYRNQITFLINFTLRHGKTPVLVTPPIAKRLDREQQRPYALMVMELAAANQLPLIDYFSAVQLRGGIDEFYSVTTTSPITETATPNAAGRAWYLKELARGIRRYDGTN